MLDDLAQAISRLRFKFAWTYADFMPHEYTVRREAADEADFVLLFEEIQRRGVIECWKRRPGRYLYVDGWRYWPMTAKMDNRLEFTRHINRMALPEVAKQRAAGLITDYKPRRRSP